MLRFSIILLLAISLNPLLAQRFHWAQSIQDEEFYSQGRAITHDADENTYVAGSFMGRISLTSAFGQKLSVVSNGGNDIFLAKYNEEGGLLWIKSIGSDENDLNDQLTWRPHLAADSAGNLYFGCTYYDTLDIDPGSNTQLIEPLGGSDFFILKLNEDGELIWAHSFGSEENDELKGLKFHPNNQLIAVGNLGSKMDFDPLYGDFNAGSERDFFVLSLDPESGAFNWVKTFGDPVFKEQVLDLAISDSGELFMSGRFEQFIVFDPRYPKSRLFSNGTSDDFILLLEAEGEFIWTKHIITRDDIKWNSRVAAGQMLYFMTTFNNTISIDEELITLDDDIPFGAVVAKFHPLGLLKWTRKYCTKSGVEFDALALSCNDRLFITGLSKHMQFNYENGWYESSLTVTPNDYFLLGINGYGRLDFHSTIGDSNLIHDEDAGYAIDITPLGGILTTGKFRGKIDINPGPDTHLLQSFNHLKPSTSAFVQRLEICRDETQYINSTSCKNGEYEFPDGFKIQNLTTTRIHSYYQSLCGTCSWLTIHKVSPSELSYEYSDYICEGDTFNENEIMGKSEVIRTRTDTNYRGCPVTKRITYHPILSDATFDIYGDEFVARSEEVGYKSWIDCTTGEATKWTKDPGFFPPSKTKHYKLQLWNGGCVDTSDCQSLIDPIDPEPIENGLISIYPNPTSGQLRIEGDQKSYERLVLSDPSGRTVIYHDTSADQDGIIDLDLSGLSNGMYLLHMYAANDEAGTMHKIILDQ